MQEVSPAVSQAPGKPLGQALARRRAYTEAIDACERSLKLALSGRRALTNQITLSEGHQWRTPWDPDHGVALAELARIHVATGALAKAITDFRMAIAAGGINAAGAWTSLAVLYARLGRWRDCVKATCEAAKRMPRDLTDRLERVQARCREAIECWREARRSKRLGNAAPQMWI